MPEACGVGDGVGHERLLLSHPLARLRPRGRGYRVLWLVRAETGGSSETALLLLTLRWNEKSRGLRVMGVRRVLDKPRGSSLGTLAAVLVLSGAAWYGAERGCD